MTALYYISINISLLYNISEKNINGKVRTQVPEPSNLHRSKVPSPKIPPPPHYDSVPEINKKRKKKGSTLTNLLGLFRLDLPGAPGHNIKIDDGVQYEEQVHRRNGQQVYDAGHDAPEFLRV